MSYLFPEGTATELGVLQVGANINVANSIISIPQSVAANANITFGNITDSSLTAGRITFAGTSGLLIDSGNLTFNSGTNTLIVPNANVTNANIANASVLGNLTLNGNSVITSITPTAGNGISLSNVTTSGPAAAFTVTNTGVLNAIASTGMNVSSATGNVTFTNTGVISLIAGTGIALSGANGNVTISATETPILSTKGVSANYTLLASDDYVGATIGSITLTLPAGVTGQQYILKNEGGSGAVTIAPTAPDTIDGASSKSMNSNASITVIFRAGAWRII